jgi:redox-sensitive bicupin YhaK (pirin superfamily)
MMFAGRGVVHSEGPTRELCENGGRQEIVQIWVNVPAECKWDDPYYQKFSPRKQPILFDQSGVTMRLAIGTYEGCTGPIETYTPMIGMLGEMEVGKRIQLSAKPGWWTMIYVIAGTINVCFETIKECNLVVFEKSNDEIIVTAEDDGAHILYLSGEPLDEPVFVKDNFVMASAVEVEQAIEDARNGKFGRLDKHDDKDD